MQSARTDSPAHNSKATDRQPDPWLLVPPKILNRRTGRRIHLQEDISCVFFLNLLHDPASWLMYLVPKQGSLLMKYFPKNLTLQADAPPSSLIAEGEGEYGSLRCALVISSFAEEKIVLERLARVMRGPGQKRNEVSNVSSMDSDSAVPEGGHCQCPWHSTVPLLHTCTV